MSAIEILYVENIISRTSKKPQQELTFFILVDNIGFEKKINVIWAGEDEAWQVLAAEFHSAVNEYKEYWIAKVCIPFTKTESLPGNIRFCAKLSHYGSEIWDNNNGQNYFSQADSGIILTSHKPVQNIAFEEQLDDYQDSIPLTIAVDKSYDVKKIIVYWTIDDWQTQEQTECLLSHDLWNSRYKSNARNPNHYGVAVWAADIKFGIAGKVQYSICCDCAQGALWDNNYGLNYRAFHKSLTVLILNLHCYQESQQDYKFRQIAKAIEEQDVDIVCFQEVAENWNDGHGDWQSNSARIINDYLAQPYHIYADWSHLGFDRYREGVAILSRFALTHCESRYVSDNDDTYSIHSRKVVMSEILVPFIGKINVFSAHLSWWEDGFKEQFTRLSDWAEQMDSTSIKGTLLCGDFNVTAGTEGYELIVANNQYEDQFLEVNATDTFERIFRTNETNWQYLLEYDYRIDYVFKKKTTQLQVISAEVIFTDCDYGAVSDHCGYLLSFEN